MIAINFLLLQNNFYQFC